MLNPVSQISLAIRENTEQLAEKIKYEFIHKREACSKVHNTFSVHSPHISYQNQMRSFISPLICSNLVSSA